MQKLSRWEQLKKVWDRMAAEAVDGTWRGAWSELVREELRVRDNNPRSRTARDDLAAMGCIQLLKSRGGKGGGREIRLVREPTLLLFATHTTGRLTPREQRICAHQRKVEKWFEHAATKTAMPRERILDWLAAKPVEELREMSVPCLRYNDPRFPHLNCSLEPIHLARQAVLGGNRR